MKLVLRKAGEPPAPGSVPVRFRHPRTGEERTGVVRGRGPLGATVVDHETSEAHKVPHGRYIEDKHAAQAPSKPRDWRAEYPGLTRYPPDTLSPKQVRVGKIGDAWRLRWKDPDTGKQAHAFDRARQRGQAGERFKALLAAADHMEGFRQAVDGHLRLGGGARLAQVAARAALVDRAGLDEDQAASTDLGEVARQHGQDLYPRLVHLLAHVEAAPRAPDGRGGVSKVTSEDVRGYLADHDLDARALRRLHGTRLFTELVDGTTDAAVREAGQAVAKRLGQTADVVLDSLVDPTVVQAVLGGMKPPRRRGRAPGLGLGEARLSLRERAFRKILDKVKLLDPYQLHREPEAP